MITELVRRLGTGEAEVSNGYGIREAFRSVVANIQTISLFPGHTLPLRPSITARCSGVFPETKIRKYQNIPCTRFIFLRIEQNRSVRLSAYHAYLKWWRY